MKAKIEVSEKCGDQVKVMIRRRGQGKHEPLFMRVGTTPHLNGQVHVFGRADQDACDRHVEVEEVIFRNSTDLKDYAAYNPYAMNRADVFRIDPSVFRLI